MRYRILTNWLGVHLGMCYYLMDTAEKPAHPTDYPETTGAKLLHWSYDGAEIHQRCNNMNLGVAKI